MKTSLVAPHDLKPNPWNSNHLTDQNLTKLIKSIKELGFVSAVVVRELDNGDLQILGGQHRVEAASELDLDQIPVLNLGRMDDEKAKKIGLVDNSRYGSDDAIELAQIYEEIGLSSKQLAEFLPFTEQEFVAISNSVNIDVDNIDLMVGDDADVAALAAEARKTKPLKTHEVLKFRVTIADAEKIRQKIEKTLKSQGLNDEDELTAAGAGLAFLLLNSTAEI